MAPKWLQLPRPRPRGSRQRRRHSGHVVVQKRFTGTAWDNACERAGLTGLQLRDLRHEAGSRFEEAGVPVTLVSKILGHTNLTTTSRYLNIHRRGLHAAMEKLEQHRPAVAQPLHKKDENPPADVPPQGNTPQITPQRFSD